MYSEIFEEKVLLKLLVLIRLGENKESSLLGVERLILLRLFIAPRELFKLLLNPKVLFNKEFERIYYCSISIHLTFDYWLKYFDMYYLY